MITTHLDDFGIENNNSNNDGSTTVTPPDVLQTGVETVDKLAHILLDMKESSIIHNNNVTTPTTPTAQSKKGQEQEQQPRHSQPNDLRKIMILF